MASRFEEEPQAGPSRLEKEEKEEEEDDREKSKSEVDRARCDRGDRIAGAQADADDEGEEDVEMVDETEDDSKKCDKKTDAAEAEKEPRMRRTKRRRHHMFIPSSDSPLLKNNVTKTVFVPVFLCELGKKEQIGFEKKRNEAFVFAQKNNVCIFNKQANVCLPFEVVSLFFLALFTYETIETPKNTTLIKCDLLTIIIDFVDSSSEVRLFVVEKKMDDDETIRKSSTFVFVFESLSIFRNRLYQLSPESPAIEAEGVLVSVHEGCLTFPAWLCCTRYRFDNVRRGSVEKEPEVLEVKEFGMKKEIVLEVPEESFGTVQNIAKGYYSEVEGIWVVK